MLSRRTTTLGEIGRIFDGPHATPSRRGTGPYFLSISSLSNGRLDLRASDHVSDEDFVKWTRRVTPRADDLLFSYETRLGEAALMPDGVKACLGRRMALIRPNLTAVHPRFLLYLYLSPQFQATIERNTIHGATVNRIPLNRMGSWAISLPSLDDQRAVADVLGALDDKIATNTALAETAEALLRTEAEEAWLGGSDRSATLMDFVELNPKLSLPRHESAPYIDMKRLPESGWSIDGWDTREPKSGARFRNGDTLLARITPCLENRKTGYVDHLPQDQVGAGSTEFIVMRSRPGIATPISFILATSPRFRDYAIQRMVGTSGRQRVAAADLADFELSRPDPEWLKTFGDRASSMFENVAALAAENRTLAETRDALLPHLMSGKVRVRDAERVASGVGA